MNNLKTKIISLLSGVTLILSIGTFVSAKELNLPGFTGTINTTVTHGLSVRTDQDCSSVRGSQYLGGDTGGAYATQIASEQSAADQSVFLSDGFGCASRHVDGYGNAGLSTSSGINLISANADNGRTNYSEGDIFDASQRVYSEIIGDIENGPSINLSLVGTYNPVIDVTGNPDFSPFSTSQIDDLESDLTLLNAYITQDVNNDVSVTIGRFVTSWGESTFIPVGMNGLTTNAVNVSALLVPGSSIKEALIPAEQISVAGYLNDSWSYEAYYQFGESHVELDQMGQLFGSDVASPGGDRLVISGQFTDNDQGRAKACGYLVTAATAVGGANKTCGAEALNYYNEQMAAGTFVKDDMYLIQEGFKAAFGSENGAALALKAGMLGTGAPTGWEGSAGDVSVLGTSAPTNVATAFSTWDEFDRKKGRKAGAVDASGGIHNYADGKDQYGLSFRTYLDGVGQGLELGFFYTQYDSKVPYLRFKGQQAITSGDLLGAFTIAAAHAPGAAATLAAYLSDTYGSDLSGGLETSESAGFGMILQALSNVGFGEAGCGAYQQTEAADELYGRGVASSLLYSSEEKNLGLQQANYTAINGKLYHDSSKCKTNSGSGVFNTAATQNAAAALLGAAISPLNVTEYEFIYPENLQAFGVSASTNFGSSVVQAEIVYRPDFPLATDGGDQGLQMSDAGGTTTLLSQAVAKGIRAAGNASSLVATSAYAAGNNEGVTWNQLVGKIKEFKRSSLPAIDLATVRDGDYYSTPYFEYDVISGTVGTTTSFSASHPINAALGADSSVFLTETGFVHVPNLDDAKAVARGGFRDGVGGDKCGGITKGGATGPTNFGGAATSAYTGHTHLGSAATDPLFGNGEYCESINNADEMSMTYRLIGSATYNNVANTPWSFSPSLVYSHDFYGYAPSSMGGWVPGKKSLSLSGSLTKGDVKASINYVNQMGDAKDNLQFDVDYVSASVSYAF